MRKSIILSLFAVFVVMSANAGYYRNKDPYTGTYTSTGRTNDMGTYRAPDGYHTDSYGHVTRNSSF